MYKLYQGDVIEQLDKLINDGVKVNCIITSPPYNKGYWSRNRNVNNGFKTKSRRIEYGAFDDKLVPDVYVKQQKEVISKCLELLTDDGSLFYNHTDILHKHQTIHPTYVYDFPLKQTIIWNRKNTPRLDKSYFFPITEYIFWFQKTKGSRVKFNRKEAMFNKNVWELNPDKNNKHPAPFPVDLPLNCILSTTDKGDLVLDPYSGSGTTGIAALQNGRKYIGIELNKDYIKQTEERFKEIRGE